MTSLHHAFLGTFGHNPQGTSLKGMVVGIGCWMFASKRCKLQNDDRCDVVCKIRLVL